MILKTIRDINCNIIVENKRLEPSIIFNESIVLLIKESKIFDEDRQLMLLTYEMLYNDKVYIVNGKQFRGNKIIIEDDWQKRFHIENFNDPSYYSWENTFLKM